MSKLAEKFNVDLTDLQNLLEGVVAFVEVRVGHDDISNEIAREMKEIGAVISENKSNKVTHVIFRNGTMRTSNWAKKHDVPLVDIGWLAACTKNKINLLSRPWHVRYLEDSVDMFGSKKRKRYKKYFKNMNLEEYEAAMLKAKEKRNKQLEKSLNNSKSDSSYEIVEHHRLPPKPDVVKRCEERLARYKETGRYSWESDELSISGDDEKENGVDNPISVNSNNKENELVSEKQLPSQNKISNQNLLVSYEKLCPDISEVDENQASNSIDKIDISSKSMETSLIEYDKSGSLGTQSTRKIVKSRRLFSQMNLSNDSLIVPVAKSSKFEESKSILPEAVQNLISCDSKKSLKRKSISNVKSVPVKRTSSVFNDELDICLPNKKISKVQTAGEQNFKSSILKISTPVKMNTKPILSTSPLVTNRSTSKDMFTTPKKSKRKSLRTRLLKLSAKKKFNETGYYEDDQSEILVPETVKIDRHKTTPIIQDCSTILETPVHLNQTTGNVFKFGTLKNQSETNGSITAPESGKKHDNSKEYSLNSSICITPNASRCLDKLLPNRSKPDSYDHILHIPKDVYYHCSSAIAPNFIDQLKYIKSNISVPFTNDISRILANKTERKSSGDIRVCSRRSTRLSARKSQNFIDLTFDNSITESDSIEKSSSANIDCDKSTNTPISIATTQTQATSPSTEKLCPSISNNGALLKLELDPLDIFRFKSNNDNFTSKHNFRIASNFNEKPVTESTKINRKRNWSQFVKSNSNSRVVKKQSEKAIKKPRDSLDDFELHPLTQKKTKIRPDTGNNELILAGFSQENQTQIKSIVNTLPRLYKFYDFITSKSQLIILPEKPKKCFQLLRALVYGNILVSEKWIHQSYQLKKWLNYSSFTIKEIDLIDVPFSSVDIISSLFSDYSSMYISSTSNGIQKYKLRIIIESAGGKVSDSFRQAGIVINTRKINALSVNELWIIDSIKEGKVLNPKQYLIL